MNRKRPTYNQRRAAEQRRRDRPFKLLIVLAFAMFAWFIVGAYQHDKARGMTVSQSLASAGF